MKQLLKNKSYLVLVLVVGGAVGFFNAVLTLMQQFMCSRGYDNSFSGLCGSLLLGTGVIGMHVHPKCRRSVKIIIIPFDLNLLFYCRGGPVWLFDGENRSPD